MVHVVSTYKKDFFLIYLWLFKMSQGTLCVIIWPAKNTGPFNIMKINVICDNES